MYRRLIFLPMILVIASLACSQMPSQLSASTSTQGPLLVKTNTPSTPTSTPVDVKTVTATETSLPALVDITPTLQPQEELQIDGGQRVSDEVISSWYIPQPGSPISMNNIFHPELNCNWTGVGGQVFAESGQPVGMLIVEMGGSLNGNKVEGLTLTGSAIQWGPGGYEFQIGQKPSASHGELWLRVLSLSGDPLSDRVYIDTFEDCTKSAIMVNFIQHAAITTEQLYFPVIIQDQQ